MQFFLSTILLTFLIVTLLGLTESFQRVLRRLSWNRKRKQHVADRRKPSHPFLYAMVVPSDEAVEVWLDSMMYSGDLNGYIRKNIKTILNDNFIGFVEEKLEETEDEDEKLVMKQIVTVLDAKLAKVDSEADGGVAYTKRLDKILFVRPNQRRVHIEETKDDISAGFVEYVQQELRATEDLDSKVVLATVLQLVEEIKGVDMLGSNSYLLQGADSSLVDQFKKKEEGVARWAGEGAVVGDGGVIGDRNEQVWITPWQHTISCEGCIALFTVVFLL